MLHVRALIKADTVILFDAAPVFDTGLSANSDQSDRGNRLKARLRWHIQGNLKALRREERLANASLQTESDTQDAGELQPKKLSYEHRLADYIRCRFSHYRLMVFPVCQCVGKYTYFGSGRIRRGIGVHTVCLARRP
jgi:hypothetical protein